MCSKPCQPKDVNGSGDMPGGSEWVTQLKRITTCFIRFPVMYINIFEFGLGLWNWSMGRSRIYGKGVHIYKGVGGSLCWFYLIYFNIPWKWTNLVSLSGGAQVNPLWIRRCGAGNKVLFVAVDLKLHIKNHPAQLHRLARVCQIRIYQLPLL